MEASRCVKLPKRKAGPSAALGMTLADGLLEQCQPSFQDLRAFFPWFPRTSSWAKFGASHSGLQGRRDARLRLASQRPLRRPDSEFGKMARAGLRRPALQILITAHLMSDLKVRPPKEKSRFLTPPKCGGFGMTARNGAIPGIRMFRFWRTGGFWGYHQIPETNHASNALSRWCIVRTTYLAILAGCRVSRTRVPRRIAISSSS